MKSLLSSKFTATFPTLMMMMVLLLFVLLFSNLCFPVLNMAAASNIESQGKALLQWKAELETQELLNTWTSKTSPCNWTGITCRNDGHLMPTITKVQLEQLGLEGKLEILNFSALPSLRVLNLSDNHIHGYIPAAISALSKLAILDLSNNKLTGVIPSELGNLTRLKTLWLFENQISGSIPPSFGKLLNLVILEDLRISYNQITGSIPHNIGNLTKLETFYLSKNNINGSIPHEIGNLINLKDLEIFDNQITGPIPSSIRNLTKIETFYLGGNNINGFIPSEIGNLVNLKALALFEDQITVNLRDIEIPQNQLTGPIPRSIGNLTKLKTFYLYKNKIDGSIPYEIGNLMNLIEFDVSDNQITSPIPHSIKNLTKLEFFNLQTNNINDTFPCEIGNLVNLRDFEISHNQITGSIPHSIGNVTKLETFYLNKNNIYGTIPPSLGSLKVLTGVEQMNELNGTIPFQLGNLNFMEVLELSDNLFKGDIPPQLSKPTELQELNLSHNELVGHIPSSFQLMTSLTLLDLSYNSLEGPVPKNHFFQTAPIKWFTHNKGLCGQVQGLPLCSQSHSTSIDDARKQHKVIILIVVLVLGALSILFLVSGIFTICCYKRKGSTINDIREDFDGHFFSVWGVNYEKEAYKEIVRATENFSEKYQIGTGASSIVYKATLSSGLTLAIKKIQEEEAQVNEQAFQNEIQTLTEIRHRNIVKFYGFCFTHRFSFLAYEYMERGSLGATLRSEEGVMDLNWIKRVSIIRDIAQALSYLHHDCAPPIIHRDITSNNILLDEEYKACVFGLLVFSRLLKT
ncbi:MDIS1-interacting receptor like kinase 2-like [Dioscorea cayenensis subsp. rotundata]|uniref:non-specific serine/threonine protein kinase n=1 Tax=Dioscorea cayennensis subsp. rotundata TaxID=55577 RepID=A0AB40ASA6_DIOCR|nr:MDIS1-interacting receptor like kinase 2-like [Dioscorea cayenensis subsp. rotundata]